MINLAARLMRQRTAQFAIFVLLYLILYRYSNVFETVDSKSTPWNPEKGVAVAAGVFFGPVAIPLVMVANFFGNMIWNPSLNTGWSMLSSAAHAIIFSGSASYFSNRLRKLASPTVSDVLFFIGFALVATVAAYFVRLGLAQFALSLDPNYMRHYLLAVYVGNLVGIVTIVPLTVSLAAFFTRSPLSPAFGIIDIFLTLSIFPVSYIVFGLQQTDEFKFFYMIFIPVVALAVRRGFTGASIAIVLSDFAMIANLSVRDHEPSTAVELQILMISLALTGSLLGAAVSERKAANEQLADSKEQLVESQSALLDASRLTLASEMASSMAHEYNQPLSAVRSFARSAIRQLEQPNPDAKRVKAELVDAVVQIDQLASLVRETRRFLSKGEKRFRAVNPYRLVDSCIAMMRQELKNAKISVTVDAEPDVPDIKAIRSQMQQVILNLVRNSKEALTAASVDKKEVVIRISRTTRTGFVEFAILDNGPGVEPTMAKSLFIPMKTTKPEGLGLGLSLSKSILLNHGGDIWYNRSKEGGAMFAFFVPVEDD